MTTLAELVGGHAGTGRALTFQRLHERCIDADTGYQPSPNLLWRIATGQDIKVNPTLIRAIATGLGMELRAVQLAAARQFIGLDVVETDR